MKFLYHDLRAYIARTFRVLSEKNFAMLKVKKWYKERFTSGNKSIKTKSFNNKTYVTPVKISQLVASLQTSRQQAVFARLVTSCQQVWNKLLTTCSKLVDIIRLVTRLFQQGCYNHDITILLQPCVVNLVTFLLYHDCVRLVRTTL